MSESIKIKELIEKIDVEKEILYTMPKNNEKNIDKYIKKISQLKEEYKDYQNKILSIFNKRYKKATKIDKNSELENLLIRLNTIENKMYLLSKEKTPYEKMELDKIIYIIGKYYKGNLETINEQIEEAIKRFDNVGINLELLDFDYSMHVTQYMKVFFEEKAKGNINSARVKEKFEEVYWKCPDIIIHIELNLRNIYFNKQSQIEKYFQKEESKLLKQWNKTPDEIINSYMEIKMKKQELLKQDKKQLLESFLKGDLNINDFTEDNIKNSCSKILKDQTKQEEIKKGVFEFLNTLYEFKNYTNFKFIIDDMKKIYIEKDKYKKAYEDIKKDIIASEKKLKKLNRKASKQGLFGIKKKEVKHSAEQNQLILEVKKKYKELDLNKFYNKIYTNLEDDSTIYDALKLANSYYNYLTNCMIKNNNTITQDKIDEQIRKLDEFLKNPYNNIINNLTILDEKDVVRIIKDRYKLLNFNIEKEDFNTKSVDSLIKTLENIEKYFCLKEVGLKVQEIEEVLQLKEILNIM